MVICMESLKGKKKRYDTKYSPLDIRLAILKHDIRRTVRYYTKMRTNNLYSIDALSYLEQLVNGINIPNNR